MPRPSSLTPEILEDVRQLAATGMSKAKMRDELGIARGTWMGWQMEKPEFKAALNVSKPMDPAVTCVRLMTTEDVAALGLAPETQEPKGTETAPQIDEPFASGEPTETPVAEQSDPFPQVEVKPAADDETLLAEACAEIEALMREQPEDDETKITSPHTEELSAEPEPAPTPTAKPHPEALAKGMIDYAAAQYPNWSPTDFHQITNAFVYGQRMGGYWQQLCQGQEEFRERYAHAREEPPEGDRAFAEEILTLIAERYAGMGEKDWRRVSHVLHVARTRGIKWVSLTAGR